MRWEQCLKSHAQGGCHGNARSLGHATRARWEVAELWKAFSEHDLLGSVQLASARSTHSVIGPYHLETVVSLQLDCAHVWPRIYLAYGTVHPLCPWQCVHHLIDAM